MSTLDLEEQEQLAALKAWWRQYGNLVLLAITLALAVVAAWNGWQWHSRTKSAEASLVFAELQRGAAASDLKKVRDAAGTLIESYPRTVYASMGALVSAKAHFDANDLKTARVQLQWAADNARDPEVQSIARLRLAQVLIDEKAFDDALKLLDAKRDAAFDGRFAEVRGDVLVAKGDKAGARAAYRTALEKAPAQDTGARELIQLKLDALGDA
jgi:predicted negative regulator of RcsB-dependent stress response